MINSGMAINDIWYDVDWADDSGLSLWNMSEQISEQYKENTKKTQAKVQKTRKDEKKAKHQDLLLAKFLVKILINKSYDPLLPSLFRAFDNGIPSNFILGIMSLVYIDISNTIRDDCRIERINFSFHSQEMVNFSWEALPQEVKDRINSWVEDIHAVILLNPSKVYTKRVIASIESSSDLYAFIEKVFVYFLWEVNIYITDKMAGEYTAFILKKIILPKL